MQVDPIKPMLKAPGTKRLKLKYDEPLLRCAFKYNLRRYNEDNAYRLAMFWNDRDTEDVTMGLNLQDFIDTMEARDPVRKAPTDMAGGSLRQSAQPA